MDVRKKIVQDFPNFYQISSISIPRSLEALRTHFFVRGSDFGLCGFGTQACPENQYEQISKYIFKRDNMNECLKIFISNKSYE